jgi:ABC-type nitrate/sulfonate/bicarbonate transport system substrate-binding protein
MTSHMKRSQATALLGTLALASIARPARAAQSVKITVPSVTPDDGAYFVGIQRGYFAAEGLDVEIVFSGGGTATPALMSGSVDGSASGSAAISAIMRGAPLRLVLVFTESPAYKIWAQPDIHSLADLKGKTVGVQTRGDTFEIATRLALQNAGLSPDSVSYTPLGFGNGPGAAFETGALGAVVISTSTAIEFQDHGLLKNAHVIADFYGKIRMPWNAFALNEKVLYGDPPLARKMVRAIVKGTRYLRTFKKQALEMTTKYQKEVNARANELEYTDFVRELTRDLTVSEDLIASDLVLRAGLLNVPKDKIPPISKVYDFSLVREVNAELDAARWKPSV